VIPWLIFALIAVPLVVVGFVASRRRSEAGERPAGDAQGLTDEEIAEAESYESKWRDEDEERYHRERLP
jgi:hypothetical protein